jgi:TonB family protein
VDKRFSKSIFYSFLFHAAILLLIYLVYHSFMVVQTPLLMDLTLIGQTSQGNGLGATSAQSGQIPQAEKTTNNNEMPAPQKEILNPSVDNSERPEVAMKKIKRKSTKNNTPSDADLEKLNNAAPIGMENQKEASTDIKTTEGVGHQGIVGAPDGDVNIEGQLAGRQVIRKVNPIYPDWAKKQGIEGAVKFQLTVLPNGLLKSDEIDPEQTSGYRELDRLVYDALIQWEFAPLPPGVVQENQSGVVTFTFNLKNQAE